MNMQSYWIKNKKTFEYAIWLLARTIPNLNYDIGTVMIDSTLLIEVFKSINMLYEGIETIRMNKSICEMVVIHD